MIRTIIESNALLYVMTAMGTLGILCQILVSRRYGRLIREAQDTRIEKKEFMKQLRFKFQTNRRRTNDQTNIAVFVRHNLMDYTYLRLRLHQWRRISAGLFLAAVLTGAAGSLLVSRAGMPQIHISQMMWTAAAVTVCSALAMLLGDIPYKRGYLQTQLEDYLGQYRAAADYRDAQEEEAHTEAVPVGTSSVIGIRRKKKTEAQAETKAQREKRELKTNLVRMKEGAQETAAAQEQPREALKNMAPEEQERIIREVLKEILA